MTDVNGAEATRPDPLPPDRGLPFAGLPRPAAEGAYGVEASAAFLRRVEYVHRKLVYLQAGHLVQRARWELKVALGRHLYEDAEAAAALRHRILDLRQNAGVLGRDPDQRLTLVLDELLHARSDEELLVGLYEIVKPALLEAERAYVRTTQQVVDYPGVRVLRTIIGDLEEQVTWGRHAVRVLVDDRGRRADVADFAERLRGYLGAAGGIGGGEAGASAAAGRRWRSLDPFTLPVRAVRDERFAPTVHYKHGAPDLAPAGDHVRARLLRMMRVRQEEMNVAELVAAVIWRKQDQPWAFTLDLARHGWDEMRHCLMGQAALEAEGVEWMSYPQFVGDFELNATNLPDAQYAWLYGIEQGAMKRTGKRAEYEFCRDEARHPLMTQFQDFDWADEVKHVHIGREWTTHLYDGDARKAHTAAGQAVEEFWEVVDETTVAALGELPPHRQRERTAG